MSKITPFLWFDKEAEEAAKYYVSLFPNSKITLVSPMIVKFTLDGQDFMALNGGPNFKFTEAVSFFIDCKNQDEVDKYWYELLADGGEESQCGWIKDKFGLWWQVIPKQLSDYVGGPDPEKAKNSMEAMLKMKKIEVDALKKAYEGE